MLSWASVLIYLAHIFCKTKRHFVSPDEVAELYGKNESSVCKIAIEEEEIRANFAVAPRTVKVTATVPESS